MQSPKTEREIQVSVRSPAHDSENSCGERPLHMLERAEQWGSTPS